MHHQLPVLTPCAHITRLYPSPLSRSQADTGDPRHYITRNRSHPKTPERYQETKQKDAIQGTATTHPRKAPSFLPSSDSPASASVPSSPQTRSSTPCASAHRSRSASSSPRSWAYRCGPTTCARLAGGARTSRPFPSTWCRACGGGGPFRLLRGSRRARPFP